MELEKLNELLKDGDYVAWDDAMDQKIQMFIRNMLPLLRPRKADDFWLSLFFPDLMTTVMGKLTVTPAVQRKVWRAMINTARQNYTNINVASVAAEDEATLGDEEIVGEGLRVGGAGNEPFDLRYAKASKIKDLIDNNVPRLDILMDTLMKNYRLGNFADVKRNLDDIAKISGQLNSELH